VGDWRSRIGVPDNGSGKRRAVLVRAFFARPSLVVAPELLGCVVEHHSHDGLVGVRLTEVEAYQGALDPASHAFRGRTPRNAVMFGDPGFVYVYFTYGMHFCMNLVCEPAGTASAVLLRAGEVVEGYDVAARRRGGAPLRELARGPARLTVALGIGRSGNGADACSPRSTVRIRPGDSAVGPVAAGPRVGVSAGAQARWRFWLDGDPTVSTYRAHVAKQRAAVSPANPEARPTSGTQGFGT
jgi:DNA-3-methyladenine glycosylase